MKIGVNKPNRLFNPPFLLSCGRCGARRITVYFYLEAVSNQRQQPGFYFDLSVRLCTECLREALAVGEQAEKEENQLETYI